MWLRWPTWCYGLCLIAPRRFAKSNSLVWETLNLDPSQANQVLARKTRSNFLDEEILTRPDLQRECIDELCSMEEMKETIHAMTEVEKETKYEAIYCFLINRCMYLAKYEPELACTEFGTKTCINYWDNHKCVCKPKWSGDRCEISECWDINQIGPNDDSGKCVPIPTEPKHAKWKIDRKTNTYQPDGLDIDEIQRYRISQLQPQKPYLKPQAQQCNEDQLENKNAQLQKELDEKTSSHLDEIKAMQKTNKNLLRNNRNLKGDVRRYQKRNKSLKYDIIKSKSDIEQCEQKKAEAVEESDKFAGMVAKLQTKSYGYPSVFDNTGKGGKGFKHVGHNEL